MTHFAPAHIVLAGGRSRRLNGVAKAGLVADGRSLLDHVVAAGAACCHQAVVGPADLLVPSGVALVREDPPFGGPVAGISAGLAELNRAGCVAEWVLVTACDHPFAETAVPALLAAGAAYAGPGAVELVAPTDSTGQVQNLFALFRRAALQRAITAVAGGRDVSVRRLVAGLDTRSPVLPDGLLVDVDDAETAARLGITVPEWPSGSDGAGHRVRQIDGR